MFRKKDEIGYKLAMHLIIDLILNQKINGKGDNGITFFVCKGFPHLNLLYLQGLIVAHG